MERSALPYFPVLLVLCFFTVITVFAIDDHTDESTLAGFKTGNDHWHFNDKPIWWIGGRPKRISGLERNFGLQEGEKDPLVSLLDGVQEPPWTIISLGNNDGKRHTVNFTPRLGRESGEVDEDDLLRQIELNRELMAQRSPPFAPRLGRRMNTYYFDPRLGKRSKLPNL